MHPFFAPVLRREARRQTKGGSYDFSLVELMLPPGFTAQPWFLELMENLFSS